MWDPDQYGRFSDHRLRPALELLARVSHDDPRLVHDIGCGRGEMARIMAQRWPRARVVGSDLSPEMLAAARASGSSRVRWERLDIASWSPGPEHDVIYANAVLHWLPDHAGLFARLLHRLAAGGILAVQMPLSWYEPSHVALRDVLATGGYGTADLRRTFDRANVGHPVSYFDELHPLASDLDIWTTRYPQILEGADPVLEWMKGSILRPVIEALDPDELARFIDELRGRLRDAYPPRADGMTVYPFPRLFIVAHR